MRPETQKAFDNILDSMSGSDGGLTEYLAPKSLDRYRVFIQSTSYTRVLVPGSNLLYEVEDR